MRNLIRKWLGIDANQELVLMVHDELDSIQNYLDAREPCKICGHHRYSKKTSQRHDEIERERKRRRKAA